MGEAPTGGCPLRLSALLSGTLVVPQFGPFGRLSDLTDPDTLRDQN